MAALDWASSSSAAPTSVPHSFDVFLSFRGKDTRNNFISFLHKALKDRGINVFIDSEKQWVGEAIGSTLRKAIEGSKISIPVFSKGYADSKWCLRELALIVQCHRSNGQLILPIFYDIDPSHVRRQEGSFKEAFCKHEEEFNPDIVKEWRDALETVGNLIGEVLDETKNQAELVELIVKRVSSELIDKTHLAICEYPVGINSSVNDLISLLNIDSNDVQFVGICGFGGIGKTTIAKAVYNDVLLTFVKHSFLSDIREQANQWLGLVSLQKRLLKDILKIDIECDDVHKGRNLIKQRLCNEKVLIVLDDVDSKEQVDVLAGKHTWFGEGSRIIITARDEHILNVAKVNNVYRPRVLDLEKSLQLFSWHAFQKDQPPDDYMKLSHDVAHYSGGLPLTLKVLGSYLLDVSDKEEWKSTLLKLKKVPNDEIQTRLKISYDNLKDDYQKTIFLDAACFFIGWEEETVMSIWEACDCYPKSTIPSLIKRSLLNFEYDWKGKNILRMHDQIRDMGREIVRVENPMEPGKRSRLWCYGDILDILKEQKGTGMMRGMSLRYGVSYPNLGSEHFQMIPNLRFLDVSFINFVGDISYLPSALRSLTWRGCNCEIIPTNFSHDRLVYADLSMSEMKQAWNVGPEDENKGFEKLKVLNLSYCKYLCKSPEFSWFPYLERLDLGGCRSLKLLDESIGQLTQLKYLIVTRCKSLEELPDAVGLLKKLEILDANACYRLKKLPRSIGRMRHLQCIGLRETNISKIPDDISSLKNLMLLNLSHCMKLQEIPELPSSLVELCCDCCCSLVQLPDLSRLKNLRNLNLKDCSKLEKIQGLEGTESLEELDASRCFNLTCMRRKKLGEGTLLPDRLLWGETDISKIPDDFSSLKNLKQLNLSQCNKLKELPELPSSLVELCCDYCYSLARLPDLWRLKNLRILNLKDCFKLEKIQGLEGTQSLVELHASGCYRLTHLRREKLGEGTLLPDRLLWGETDISKLPDDFSSLKNLKQLNLSQCKKLKELPELPSSLVELCCNYCHSLVRLSDLSRLKILRILQLKDCFKLEKIQGLEGTHSLEELDASGCYKLTRTQRKKLGQGTLLPDRLPVDDYSFTVTDEIYSTRTGLILCIVFSYNNQPVLNGSIGTPDLRIRASVCQEEKTIRCLHELKIEGVEYTTVRDTIYIHYFKGFDWFGIPLQEEDAITILDIWEIGTSFTVKFWKLLYENKKPYQQMPNQYSDASPSFTAKFWKLLYENKEPDQQMPNQYSDASPSFTVKFWKLLYENKEPDQQMPNQYSDASPSGNNMEEIELSDFFDLSGVYEASPSSNTEEEKSDFFDWSRVYKPSHTEHEISLGLSFTWPSPLEVEGSNSVPTEKFYDENIDDALSLSLTRKLSHVQENGKTPPPSPSPSHHTEEEDPERNNTMIESLSCLGFDSVSDVVEKEGEMLSPSNRARLHDNK